MPLYQPSNVTPSDLSGNGAIDATAGMTVTWQVNGSGNVPMVAYRISIMKNDIASTPLYDTGRVALSAPFYGTDSTGSPVYFVAQISASVLAANGIVNSASASYKYLITQYWGNNESVTQNSANVFVARSAPTVQITNYASTISSINYTFTGAYSQAQNAPIKWVRWQMRENDSGAMLVDTGAIYNVGPLQSGYDGFMNGFSYSVRLSGETSDGVEFDTGWKDFSANYPATVVENMVTACQKSGFNFVEVTANITAPSAARFMVYRRKNNERSLRLYAEIDRSLSPAAFRDYGATNGNTYHYYVFVVTGGASSGNVYASNPVTPCAWDYDILLCDQNGENYRVQQEYRFSLDVSSGSVGNNNKPTLQANFTPYPLRQPTTQNYRNGALTAYTGKPVDGRYTDDIKEIEAIRQISTSTLAKFLKTRKGELIRIETSDPITMATGDKYAAQPVRASIPWVEVGSADSACIVTTPADAYWDNND